MPSTVIVMRNCWVGTARLKRDGTCAETRFGLSVKRTSPFKLAGGSVQSTTGSWGVLISSSNGSNAGYTMFWGRVQDYWLPTPLACFPFTSPTVRHHVPSGFNWALLHSFSMFCTFAPTVFAVLLPITLAGYQGTLNPSCQLSTSRRKCALQNVNAVCQNREVNQPWIRGD